MKILSNALSNAKYLCETAGRKIEKRSPELLLALGIISGAGAIVMACKQTLKCEEILDRHAQMIEEIDKTLLEHSDEYSEKDAGRDKMVAYIKTGAAFSKLYSPVVILSSISLISFLSSYGILKKRNIVLASMYGALDRAFKEYRERVIENLGEDTDAFFRSGYSKKNIKIKELKEGGEIVEKEEEMDVIESAPHLTFLYSRDTSDAFYNSDTMNRNTIRMAEELFTKIIRTRKNGVVFLNEVLRELKMELIPEGQIVG